MNKGHFCRTRSATCWYHVNETSELCFHKRHRSFFLFVTFCNFLYVIGDVEFLFFCDLLSAKASHRCQLSDRAFPTEARSSSSAEKETAVSWAAVLGSEQPRLLDIYVDTILNCYWQCNHWLDYVQRQRVFMNEWMNEALHLLMAAAAWSHWTPFCY